MSTLLDRLGRACARNHRLVIGAWILAAVAVVVLAAGLDGTTSDNFRIPGAQSQEALDLLVQRFPTRAGDSATVVFEAKAGIRDASVEPAITTSVAALEKIPHVSSVTDPFGPLGAALISKSGTIALVTVQYDTQAQKLSKDAFKQLEAATASATAAGVRRVRRGRRRLRRPTTRGERRPGRAARRGGHPAVRVRLRRRDGPPDPHRAVRVSASVSR